MATDPKRHVCTVIVTDTKTKKEVERASFLTQEECRAYAARWVAKGYNANHI